MQVVRDLLSEVLGSVRLTGAVFLRAELSAPWGFRAGPSSASAQLAPGFDHLVPFHLVVEGRASVQLEGESPVLLEAGDVVVLPRGDAHMLYDEAPCSFVDSSRLLPQILKGEIVVEKGGGGGAMTRFVCGYVGCDRYAERTLFTGLPSVLRVTLPSSSSGEAIALAIGRLAAEAGLTDAGGRALRARLTEALLIEVLRCHMRDATPAQRGWLAAARDPAIGLVLSLIHDAPGHAWTLAELSRRSGTSRTVLMQRFRGLLDESPIGYLTRLRVHLGARLLQSTERTILDVALSVGYESEAAFNRAFKREMGVPPGRFRQRGRTTAGESNAPAPPVPRLQHRRGFPRLILPWDPDERSPS